ncbi:MAG: biopolymer transporter ExbD [Pirellulales bacterium]
MRRASKFDTRIAEPDLTPMIDMTFQLIAFFMVLVNFSTSEQNDKVVLPNSELAKPILAAEELPITLHVLEGGNVVIGGITATIEGLRPLLETEILLLETKNKKASDANIIIRAHRGTQGGRVQDLIDKCKQMGFEKFSLRVKEESIQ